MTIIVFLVDTSASMYQRAYLGGRPSILDVAKNAVETFVKVRQRSQESRGDRYMLLTFEDPPNNIKAGWKENLSTFMNELKNLQCLGLTSMGSALKHTFDVLNLNRMQTGIDTYGQGRCPFYLEPSVILVITDGGKLSSPTGVQDDFNLPMHSPIPGSELTREPFRWDQRLFALVLRLSGTPANERDIGLVPSDNSPIDAMCEVTGGRSYCITSHRMMMQCIDSLVQKVQSGVVINFEKIGPDPTAGDNRDDATTTPIIINHDDENENEVAQPALTEAQQLLPPINKAVNAYTLPNPAPSSLISWHSCRKMIFVPRSAQKGFAVGFWPIPESFWPDINVSVLPARSAHPNVKFTCVNQEPMVIENLPFDKYELEPSPLTQFILARKQPTICWQVFVPNSYKNSEVGHPFGYLKASTNLTCVNLFVMPYNYPVLLPLLDDLFKVLRLKQTPEWTVQFRNYMRTMPSYYVGPLRRALTRMGAPNSLAQTLIPDTCEATLGVTVLNYVKKLKNQAKIEFDRLCNDVLTKQNAQTKLTQQATITTSASTTPSTNRVRVVPRAVLKRDLVTHPCMHDKFLSTREQLNEYGGFVVGLPTSRTNLNTKSFRNPYHINRSNLLDQVVRMRSNYLQPVNRMKLIDDDVTHSLPVNQMGNYQEYLKRMPPALREIESTPVRQHMFGNPFKIDKRMMVDEADIDLVGGNTSGALGSSTMSVKAAKRASGDIKAPPPKRKPRPIPKEFVIRRPPTALLIPTANLLSSTNSCPSPTTSAVVPNNTVPSPASFSVHDVKEEPISSKSAEEEKPVVALQVPRTIPSTVEPILTINDAESKDLSESTSSPALSPSTFVNNVNNDVKPCSTTVSSIESLGEEADLPNLVLNDTPSLVPNSLPPLQPSSYQISDYLSPLNYNNYSLSEDIINENSSGQFAYNNAANNDHDLNNELKFEKRLYNSLNNNGITDSANDTSCPVLETDPEIYSHNLKIKKMLFQDVRRPGRDHSGFWNHMTLLKGEFYIQEVIIKQLHLEALRFKRQTLARSINTYLEISRIDSINNTQNGNGNSV